MPLIKIKDDESTEDAIARVEATNREVVQVIMDGGVRCLLVKKRPYTKKSGPAETR